MNRLELLMRLRARKIRARLWRPPNAVPDRGIDLRGKAVNAALLEHGRRHRIEQLQFAEQLAREESNARKKVAK